MCRLGQINDYGLLESLALRVRRGLVDLEQNDGRPDPSHLRDARPTAHEEARRSTTSMHAMVTVVRDSAVWPVANPRLLAYLQKC